MENKVEHLGIIIDGNRRYAKAIGVELETSYMLGAEKVYEIIKYVFEHTEVIELTIFALSYDNLIRDAKELEPIISIQNKYFKNWCSDPFFEKKQIKIRFVGRLYALPNDIQETCAMLEKKTAKNNKKVLNILMAYTGHLDIADTIKQIVTSNIQITENSDVEKIINENIQISRPVDVVIRTSGENRLSGFLLWQSEYAELYSIKKTWPEVTAKDIKKVLNDYKNREIKKGL